MSKGSVLVADDDAAIRTVLSQALTRAGFEVKVTSNIANLVEWVQAGEGDAVVTDVMMPDGNVFDHLEKLKKIRPNLPFIVMSAQNTFMTAITASEKGAYEYLPKPFDLQELSNIVSRAISEPMAAEVGDEGVEGVEGADNLPLVGRSAAMQDVYRVLARMMHNDLTVLITGESGTGKGLVANALHQFGQRKNKPFVTVNISAQSAMSLASELFGEEENSNNHVAGKIEQAQGGTLFLDEVGDIPLAVQSQLLLVLQNKEFFPRGAKKPIKSDVRIIGSSNKDIAGLIEKGEFREDLFYRINVVPVRLPALRERIEDLPDLTRHFLHKHSDQNILQKEISAEGLKLLQKYRWPGNVRELENLVQRLAVLYKQDIITTQILENELDQASAVNKTSAANGEMNADISLATEQWLRNYFANFVDRSPPPGLYINVLRKLERPLITACLAYTRGNQIKAAELLGLNRNTLRKKIKDLDIKVYRGSY